MVAWFVMVLLGAVSRVSEAQAAVAAAAHERFFLGSSVKITCQGAMLGCLRHAMVDT